MKYKTKNMNKIIYQDNSITKFDILSKRYGNHGVIIDTEDYEKVKIYKWHVQFDNKENKLKRVVSSENKALHKIILNTDIINNNVVDHKNGNVLDNRKCNLRICTISQNGANRGKQKNNKSGYKGVINICKAVIRVKGERIELGFFKNAEEAAKAYNEAAIKYFGEFAKLNIIGKELLK